MAITLTGTNLVYTCDFQDEYVEVLNNFANNPHVTVISTNDTLRKVTFNIDVSE